jgi:hypothetical protein
MGESKNKSLNKASVDGIKIKLLTMWESVSSYHMF